MTKVADRCSCMQVGLEGTAVDGGKNLALWSEPYFGAYGLVDFAHQTKLW